MKTLFKTVLIIIVLMVLMPLWYWALFGMSKNVGVAWIITISTMVFALFLTWLDEL